MADTLALEKLYNDVQARFTSEGTAVTMSFGWDAPHRLPGAQTSVNRIVWTPGDPSQNVGTIAPPRAPGRNPRPLGTLLERFTVTISALDISAPENELVQYRAARFLYDAWFRAVYLAAHGTFEVNAQRWLSKNPERMRGAAIEVVATIQSMLPDSELESAPVDTNATITVTELDVTDPAFIVEPEA